MLALLRQSPALRLVAALLLTGAPRLAGALAPEPEHRCTCASHGEHRCSCPICAARARSARNRRIAALPPCCREAARRAAAEEDRAAIPAGPCLGAPCGGGEGRGWVAPEQESFTPATVPGPWVPEAAEPLQAAAGRGCDRPRAPEPPPPRR